MTREAPATVALDSSALADALADALAAPAPDFLTSAKNWATAYAGYAAEAQSCQVVPPLPAAIEAAQETLQAALAAAFAGGVDPASTATGLATAFSFFWLLPPVAFQGVTPGVVTAVGGATALSTALVASWTENTLARASASDAASTMAAVLDAFTRTVVVTHAPPTACASPLV